MDCDFFESNNSSTTPSHRFNLVKMEYPGSDTETCYKSTDSDYINPCRTRFKL